jgi:hypothetical protein
MSRDHVAVVDVYDDGVVVGLCFINKRSSQVLSLLPPRSSPPVPCLLSEEGRSQQWHCCTQLIPYALAEVCTEPAMMLANLV